MSKGGLLLTLVFCISACQAGQVATSSDEDSPTSPAFLPGGNVEMEEVASGELIPEAEPNTRRLRRVDLDQLNELFLGATEGIYWSETGEVGGDNLLEELAGTLGVPDYALMTYEDLEPSLIFQKYLGDAARSICMQLAQREQSDGAAAVLLEDADLEDTWETAPEKIDANLSRLLLRFHGRSTELHPESLELWRWLFRSAHHVSEDTAVAWRTICVGLISHPDFYLH